MNTLIQSMVALDPEQRPAGMQEIKEALQEIKQLLSPPKIQNIYTPIPSSNSYGTPLWTPGGQSLQQQQVRAPAYTNRYGGPLWGSGRQQQPIKPPSSSTNRYGGPLWTSSEQSQQQQQVMVPPPPPHYTPPPTKSGRSRNYSSPGNRYGGPIWPSQQPTPKQPNRTRRRLMVAGAGVGIALFAGWMHFNPDSLQIQQTPTQPTPAPTQIPTEDTPQMTQYYVPLSDYTPSPDFHYSACVSATGILNVYSLIGPAATGGKLLNKGK